MEQAGVAGQAAPRKRKSNGSNPLTTAIVPVAGATVAEGRGEGIMPSRARVNVRVPVYRARQAPRQPRLCQCDRCADAANGPHHAVKPGESIPLAWKPVWVFRRIGAVARRHALGWDIDVCALTNMVRITVAPTACEPRVPTI